MRRVAVYRYADEVYSLHSILHHMSIFIQYINIYIACVCIACTKIQEYYTLCMSYISYYRTAKGVLRNPPPSPKELHVAVEKFS